MKPRFEVRKTIRSLLRREEALEAKNGGFTLKQLRPRITHTQKEQSEMAMDFHCSLTRRTQAWCFLCAGAQEPELRSSAKVFRDGTGTPLLKSA